jgi:hypothetical protein
MMQQALARSYALRAAGASPLAGWGCKRGKPLLLRVLLLLL